MRVSSTGRIGERVRPRPIRDGAQQRGQALPFFAVMLAGLIMAVALVIDGGATLVRHRQLQNAADAAATVASHQFGDIGCAAAGGAPRSVIVSTARDTVRDHLPGFPDARITVSCPAGYENFAVKVDLRDTGQATFMLLMNSTGLALSGTATAINRPIQGTVDHAVMTLNPGHFNWTQNRGCPGLKVEGSASLEAFTSVHVNSSCTNANGGALATIGSAQMTVQDGALTVVGEATGRGFSPAPRTGQPSLSDPYASHRPPAPGSLPMRSSSRLAISGTRVLEPGIYRGGLDVTGNALLLPGIYYIDGGGILVRGHGAIYSVNGNVTSTSPSRWSSDCTPGQCGALIYNTGGGLMGPLHFTGGGMMKLRGYSPGADRNGIGPTEYTGFAIWQDRQPRPSNIQSQPMMILEGNQGHDLYGIVYLPSARASMVGSASFSLAASFVVWELELIGSAGVVLRYDPTAFPPEFDYGLVE